MLINEAFPSNYLKAADLQGRSITLQIDRCVYEEVNNERKLCMYFVGKEKGMILNKTNANTIASAYGQNTDDWRDAEIVLFMAMVDFQGKTVEALRVKIPPRKPAVRRQESGHDDPRNRDDNHGSAPVRPMASADIDDDIPFAMDR